MKFLRHILRRSQPIRLDDSAFGLLTYNRLNDDWMGTLGPGDCKEDVEVTVYAGKGGPSERQRELFTELKRRLTDLPAVIEAPLAASAKPQAVRTLPQGSLGTERRWPPALPGGILIL